MVDRCGGVEHSPNFFPPSKNRAKLRFRPGIIHSPVKTEAASLMLAPSVEGERNKPRLNLPIMEAFAALDQIMLVSRLRLSNHYGTGVVGVLTPPDVQMCFSAPSTSIFTRVKHMAIAHNTSESHRF